MSVLAIGPPRCGNIFLSAGLRIAFPSLMVVGPGQAINPQHVNKHSIDDMRVAQEAGMVVVSPLREPDKSVRSFLSFTPNPRGYDGPVLNTQRADLSALLRQVRTSRQWGEYEIVGYLQSYSRLVNYQMQHGAHFVDFTDLTRDPDQVLDQLQSVGALPHRGRRVVPWHQVRDDTRPRDYAQVSLPDDIWEEAAVEAAMSAAEASRKNALSSQT